ncbi:MAG: hypothetical protein ACK4QP_00465 [Pseudorhizobium sp.]
MRIALCPSSVARSGRKFPARRLAIMGSRENLGPGESSGMSNLYLVLMVGCNTKYSVNGLFLPVPTPVASAKKAQEIALASGLHGSPAIVRFLLEPAERTGLVTFGPVAAATRDAISSVPLDSSRRRSPYILNHKILCQYPVENGDREKNQKSQVFARLRCSVERFWRSFMHRQGEAATCMKKRVLQIGL